MSQALSSNSKGFLKSLYDFKFSVFVTSKVVRALYIIITILYSLGAVASFIEFARRGGVGIILAIIVVPLGYLLYLTLARMLLEFIIVVFRIGEDVRALRDLRPATQAATPSSVVQSSSAEQAAPPTYAAGWYSDPNGVARARYWDGQQWTAHTQD
jgi:hypothetical protein